MRYDDSCGHLYHIEHDSDCGFGLKIADGLLVLVDGHLLRHLELNRRDQKLGEEVGGIIVRH